MALRSCLTSPPTALFIGADLDVLSALNKGLRAVSSGAAGNLPWQRPPGTGEEGLATRHPG